MKTLWGIESAIYQWSYCVTSSLFFQQNSFYTANMDDVSLFVDSSFLFFAILNLHYIGMYSVNLKEYRLFLWNKINN